MGSIDPLPSFEVLRDTRPDDTTLPAFMVSTTRGFLPRQEPIVALPKEFDILESLLTRMPIKTLEGTPGLLGTFTLGETVLKELPDLTYAIEIYKDNLPLMNALYRDYSFLASAYLLEPCHERFVNGEGYGLGRQTLPSVIALPISRCAELYVIQYSCMLEEDTDMLQCWLQAVHGIRRVICTLQLPARGPQERSRLRQPASHPCFRAWSRSQVFRSRLRPRACRHGAELRPAG